MPVAEKADVLTELEALSYTDGDCVTELTELVAGLLKRSHRDPNGHRARTHYRDVLDLAERMLLIRAGEGSWRGLLVWACEEFADQPEIQRFVTQLFDR